MAITPAELDASERRRRHAGRAAIVLGVLSATSAALAVASFVTSRSIVEVDGMASTIEILVTLLAAVALGVFAVLAALVALGFAAASRA